MSTTCPRPLRRAWKIAIRRPLGAVDRRSSSRPAAPSTGIGGRSGNPVVNCTPENACAMRSSPRSPASGPVCPNGEMRRMARRGLRALQRLGRQPGGLEPPRAQILDERVGGWRAAAPATARVASSVELGLAPSTCRGSPTGSRASPPRRGRAPAAAAASRRAGSILTTVAPEIGEQAARELAGRGSRPARRRSRPASAPPRPASGAPAARVHERLKLSPKMRAAFP